MYFLYKYLVKLKVDLLVRYMLRKKIRILMFHGIIDDNLDLDCWWLLKESKFINQIEYLGKYYHFISLDEALSDKILRENAYVLTFDDGYKSIFTRVYPILKEKGIPFTVYVTTGPVEEEGMIWTDRIFLFLQDKRSKRYEEMTRLVPWMEFSRKLDERIFQMEFLNRLKGMHYREKNELVTKLLDGFNGRLILRNKADNPFEMLSVEDIKTLSEDPLVTIGAHTVNHEILTRMALPEAVAEISQSREKLEKWTSQKIRHFSYPDGKYSNALAEKVRELGFKSATRIGLMVNWRNKPYELCRIATDPNDDDLTFQLMVNGVIPLKVQAKHFFRMKRRL